MKRFLIVLVINIFFTSKSFSLIEIDITRGNLDPLPIAVSPLHVDIKSENSAEGFLEHANTLQLFFANNSNSDESRH